MKIRTFVAIAVTVVAMISGCKSKETTSAIIHNQTGRYDLAIQTASEALAKNPNDAEAHFQLGIAYSRLDSTALAYQNFVEAKKLDPTREKIIDNNIQSNFAKHYNRALNMEKEDDWKTALDELRKATESDPTQPKGFYQLGKACIKLAGDDSTHAGAYYDRAIKNLDKVLEVSSPSDKTYIDALSLAGEALAVTGRSDEAASRFDRLVEEDPTNYRIIEKIGNDRLDQKDWRGATVFLDLAAKARAKIGAEDFTLYYNLGVAHYQLRKEDPAQLQKAIEYYEMALNLNPSEPQTTFNIVVAYVQAENWQQAIAWGEKYVSLNPDNADIWRLLGKAYNEVGDQDKARRCLARYEEAMKRKGN
jgi:tetratricopeptide (TPR) repeat protein